MKIKVKLTKNQYKALYYVCSSVMPLVRDLPNKPYNNNKLLSMAVSETTTSFFMRLTKKMLDLKPTNTLTLTITEAYSFHVIMVPIVDQLEPYEKIVIYDILNEINQKTS